MVSWSFHSVYRTDRPLLCTFRISHPIYTGGISWQDSHLTISDHVLQGLLSGVIHSLIHLHHISYSIDSVSSVQTSTDFGQSSLSRSVFFLSPYSLPYCSWMGLLRWNFPYLLFCVIRCSNEASSRVWDGWSACLPIWRRHGKMLNTILVYLAVVEGSNCTVKLTFILVGWLTFVPRWQFADNLKIADALCDQFNFISLR